jgi:enoyl-CoA hydratase/carnithine racemase
MAKSAAEIATELAGTLATLSQRIDAIESTVGDLGRRHGREAHMATNDILLLDIRDGVAHLTLNRPERRNALSHDLLRALLDTQVDLSRDSAVRAVVVAGNGPAFCAGHDLGEMVGRSEADYAQLFDLCSQVMLGFRRLTMPVIARVHGVATAAGCQLVAACDLAIASENAAFATPGVKIGLFCTTPMVPLVRTIAPRAALEMLLTGKPISAAQALQWGLINRVVAPADLDHAIKEFTDSFVASSPLTLRLGKVAFYDGLGQPEEAAYQLACRTMTDNATRHDAQEGMSAFLQKRRPQWTGA